MTRSPVKRWDWNQVSRWLNGERNIPQYFEDASSVQSMMIKPFAFMGKKCSSLAEIASAFVQSEEAWEKGRNFLMRGNIRQWLENNSEFEQAEAFEQELSKIASDDGDEKMFCFTQQYGENIPLIFGGKLITLSNLLLFAGKAVKRENATPAERKIVAMLTSGRLIEILRSYAKTANDDDSKVLLPALETLSAKPSELSIIAGFLEFYLNPQKFFCPFVKDTSSTESVIESSQGLQKIPGRVEDFKTVSDEFIIPKSIIDSAKNVSTYFSSLDELDSMLQNNRLISRRKIPESEKKEIERLESASMPDYTKGLYKWQWGYDDVTVALIDSLLKTNRKQAKYSSRFKRAEAELWIAYIEFLNRKARPLSDEDKRILNGTADGLNKYLSETYGHTEDFRIPSENYQREKQEHERLLELEAQGIRLNHLAKLRKFSMSFVGITVLCALVGSVSKADKAEDMFGGLIFCLFGCICCILGGYFVVAALVFILSLLSVGYHLSQSIWIALLFTILSCTLFYLALQVAEDKPVGDMSKSQYEEYKSDYHSLIFYSVVIMSIIIWGCFIR